MNHALKDSDLQSPLQFSLRRCSSLYTVLLCQPGHFCAIILTSAFVYFLFQALRGMASENDGHVTCPKTKETFRVDQADKVYVM